MTFATATIAGAGLAGLNAAVSLVEAGLRVTIADAAAREGGRCRAYHDPSLGCTIDNGNHIVLSGNTEVRRFLDRTGGDWAGAFVDAGEAAYAFADLRTGERWTVRINDGPLPWWIAARSRRVPGTGIADYLPLSRLLNRREGRVGDRIATRGPLWDRLLDPVLLAALNTAPADGSAALTAATLRETIAKGGRHMVPRVAAHDLDAALIAPARA
ncbi:MAG: FAD-dependent oxidoreductase, partial [Janthinobacterium lividum]